jgi:hypothetical protein
MIVTITFSILAFILGVQLIIKFTTNELDRPYRIIKRQYYDVGKLKNEYYVVQKQKQFLFIKYWNGVECEDSWDTTNVPSFDSFDEAYTLLQKCKQQKPLNGIKDEVELEWNKYPIKID